MERWENETVKESYWVNVAEYESLFHTSSDGTSESSVYDGADYWSTAGNNGSST